MNRKTIFTILLLSTTFSIAGCTQNEPTDSTCVIDGKLVAPTISIDENKVLNWELNESANYYSIYVDDSFKAVTDTNCYQLEDRINGTYNVKICAHDKFNRYQDSEYSNIATYTIAVKELKAPIVSIEADTLKWADIEGADYYRVYLDTEYQHSWKIRKDNGVNSCKMSFTSSGNYEVVVKAFSNDLNYEREKSNSPFNYKISLDKVWYPTSILNDWTAFGDVQTNNNFIVLNEGKNVVTSGIRNNVLIDENHNQLYLGFKQGDVIDTTKYAVKVNNTEIYPIANEAKDPSIGENVYVYDLSHYDDIAAAISVELKDNITLNIESLRIFTNDNTSHLTKWDNSSIPTDWICSGATEKHGEGYCLACNNGTRSSFSTNLKIENNNKLSFAIRKFERMGAEQDANPLVYVYINNTLVKPIDSVVDYATCTGDAYEYYYYDLSSYSGQTVAVKIESIIGEHCCFGMIQIGE